MKKGITSIVSFQELEFACRLATIVLRPSFLPCYLGAFHGVFLVVCSLSTLQLSRLNTFSPCVLFTVFTLQSYLSPYLLDLLLCSLTIHFLPYYLPFSLSIKLTTLLFTLQPS
jgi:hypothetical protein